MNRFRSIISTKGLFCKLSVLAFLGLLTLNLFKENPPENDNGRRYASVSVVETKKGTSLVIITYPTNEKNVGASQVSLKMSLADSISFGFLTQITMPATSESPTGYEVIIYELMADKASFRVTKEDFNHEGFTILGPRY